jgi:ADP-ribosylglycohydrolase
MLGAIVGDVVGSVYEGKHLKKDNFTLFDKKCRFTDDTVLTVATMDALATGMSYNQAYKKYYKLYPNSGYGSAFKKWASSESSEGYGSYGNGSAMRVSPVPYCFGHIDEVLLEAAKSACVTHDDEEGIKGAKAIASSIYLGNAGYGKNHIRTYIEDNFEYDLGISHNDLIDNFTYEISCQATVPLAIMSFLSSESYEECIRKSMLYGADTDTLACMAGSIAETKWDIPKRLSKFALRKLDAKLKKKIILFCKSNKIYIR